MREALSGAEWLVTETGFDPARANVYETLCTVGNGYLGTRGTLEEGHPGDLSGTYLNGVYDDHDSPVIDLVNAPDWLAFAVHVGGSRLDVRNAEVLEHERTLDIRTGLLHRRTVFADAQGRRTRLETLRCASVSDRHTCAVRIDITPENHDAEITVESALDGRRRNLERLPLYPAGTTFPLETRWEKWALTRHLERTAREADDDVAYLEMRTIASGITIGYAMTTTSSVPPTSSGFTLDDERVTWRATFPGVPLRLDKIVRIGTSRDVDRSAGTVRDGCLDGLVTARATGFDGIVAASRAEWDRRWADCDCVIDGDSRSTHAVRFGLYHLLIAANDTDPTVNIGAKSLSGEGYRGHVFWDTEILMLPFFIYTRPDAARHLLAYRHHTLPGARENARINGTGGARYPWESADSGREECPEFTPDGANKFWTRDEELHVSADVAHGVLQYVEATGDRTFLVERGAEILFETSRFWVERAVRKADGTYSLLQVMGPDEFHSHTDDNAFTNHLVRWHLENAARVHDDLKESAPGAFSALSERIGLATEEVDRWRAVAAAIQLPRQRPDRLIEQFTGYFDRLDVPVTEWDENDMPRYPVGYHHFNCEDTQLLKQPDVVMLLYLLPDAFDQATKRANFDYYEARTLHKSSLSPSIHAIMGIEVGDPSRAEQYFARSAFVDLTDNQGNTAEGMHIASAGGTWQVLVCGFGGFRVAHGQMSFSPWLPDRWKAIHFRLRWRGNLLRVAVDHAAITFEMDGSAGVVVPVLVHGRQIELKTGTTTVPHELAPVAAS
ncbi:MAG TPA: glycosyl hydrolase family 65 protein [Pseudonocardia sp.]